MSKLISVTKIGFFDGNNSRYTCDSEAVNVVDTNIADVETDGSGAIIMFQQPINLDGGKVTGFVVTQTQAQINTLMNSTASTVTAADGTVALPSIAFNSDPDNGFYYIGANNFGAATNGTKILDFASTGLTSSLTTDSTSASATAPLRSLGGAAIAKTLWVGNFANVQGLIKRPVTTTTVAAGALITGAMIATGYIEVTGTTNSSALDTCANITTALGTSPIGTTFDFVINTIGATPMTAGNILTITAGANTTFMKQVSAGDSASAFLATVTATAGVHLAHYRVSFDTATTCTIQRIG